MKAVKTTKQRSAEAFVEMTGGYGVNLANLLRIKFPSKFKGVVEVAEIPFTSLCEHHLMPFVGKVTIRYKPKGGVVGLSKLVRLVEALAKRLQLQENLSNQIGRAVMKYLAPYGCEVKIEAEHTCVSCRGVTKAGVVTRTHESWGKM